jgi:CARDB
MRASRFVFVVLVPLAVRKFEIWTCAASCASGGTFTKAFTSADDAFPGAAPRPVAPNLIMRSFTLPSPVTASAVRLVVDTTQCTGGPAYAGEQDNDPTNNTDCAANSSNAGTVNAAELEVFGSAGAIGQPDLQVTALTVTTNGENYTATVSNTGNAAAGASTTQFKLDGTQICAVSTPAIAAGGSATVKCKAKAPSKGTHTAVATADSANVVAESNESNNSKTITFTK